MDIVLVSAGTELTLFLVDHPSAPLKPLAPSLHRSQCRLRYLPRAATHGCCGSSALHPCECGEGMALVGEVIPEGDRTHRILPVPLPHHPSPGSPSRRDKNGLFPCFLCFNPDQFTDPSLIGSSRRHEGRGRGMGRSPRPKLHSPNCAGTAGPAANWEQQLSNTMAWPQEKPRTACSQLAQPCPVSYKPGTRNQLSVPSESGSGARALRDTLGWQSAPEV